MFLLLPARLCLLLSALTSFLSPVCAPQTPAGSRGPRPTEQTPPSLIDWWESRAAEPRWWRSRCGRAVGVEATGPHTGIQQSSGPGELPNGCETSSISQLVCCSSREAQYLEPVWFEEEEAQADVALSKNTITPPAPGALFYKCHNVDLGAAECSRKEGVKHARNCRYLQ